MTANNCVFCRGLDKKAFGVEGVDDEQRPFGAHRDRLAIHEHSHHHIVITRIGHGQLHTVIVERHRPNVLTFGLDQLQHIAQQGAAE